MKGTNSILAAGLVPCQSQAPLRWVTADQMLKSLNEVFRDKGGDIVLLLPCILKASLKLRRVLSSLTFDQEGHLSLAVCNVALAFWLHSLAVPRHCALSITAQVRNLRVG